MVKFVKKKKKDFYKLNFWKLYMKNLILVKL